ncbi:hypothetical protein CYJ73_18640 [Gordonia terrae]|uniref:Uncharacterized protein n=2 Tax=Gordonia terrae TaxID=2055 RepID=A0A2I1R4T1_9ACTN|nr:hypothetical protein CYJ73_18640 [Gordonia terrae]
MVNDRGMTMTDQAAQQLLTERVQAVAERMRVGVRQAQTYLTDEALTGVADSMVETLADEAPGADLATEPRTTTLTVGTLGRLIAGLAEVALLYTDPTTTLPPNDHTRRTHEVLTLLSVTGLIQADTPGSGPVAVPPALLTRIARILTTAAEHTDNTDLAATLRRDAMRASG